MGGLRSYYTKILLVAIARTKMFIISYLFSSVVNNKILSIHKKSEVVSQDFFHLFQKIDSLITSESEIISFYG